MRPFAILRVKKLKSLDDIQKMQCHWRREHNCPNVRREHTKYNQCLIGSLRPLQAFKKTIHDKRIKVRKNAVYGLEFILTFSPEFIKDEGGQYSKDTAEKLRWWRKQSVRWIKSEFGDRCVCATLELDESTPHIHLFVIPTEQKTKKNGDKVWCLNARKITGGRQKLIALQDSYAKSVSKYLRRGIKNSKASHTELRQYYSLVNASKGYIEMELDKHKDSLKEHRSWADQALNLIKKSTAIEGKNKKLLEEQQELRKCANELTEENKALKNLLTLIYEKFNKLKQKASFGTVHRPRR